MIGDFVDIGLDPWQWRPAPLINQVVLVGTVEETGAFDLAPKTSAFFASTALPAVGFSCNTTHHTACNISRTGAFVVNVPEASHAAKIWDVFLRASQERLAAAGWHARAGDVVAGACWDEAVAQLECTHHATIEIAGEEIVIIGRVVAARLRATLVTDVDGAGPAAAYRVLDPLFYLQPGLFTGLGEVAGPPRSD